MIDSKEALRKALIELKERGPGRNMGGICSCVEASIYDTYQTDPYSVPMYAIKELMRSLFVSWSEFSGNITFPVPYTDECEFINGDPMVAYITVQHWTGTYGEARKRLLDYMIDTLSATPQ